MSEFCSRQPGVCKTGSAVAGLFEAKAKNGVSLIYNWATETNVISQANASEPYLEANLATTAGPGLDSLIATISNERNIKAAPQIAAPRTRSSPLTSFLNGLPLSARPILEATSPANLFCL